MSHIEIGQMEAGQAQVGDHNTMHVHGAEHVTVPVSAALVAVESLAQQVEDCQRAIGEMAAALEQLRADLSARPVRKARLMPLLQLIGAGAQDVTAVAAAVENVQHLVSHVP